MSKKRFAVMGILLSFVLVLAACAPKEEMSVEMPQEVEEAAPAQEVEEAAPTEEEVVVEQPAATEVVETPVPADASEMSAQIDVEALIAEKVAGNHDVERIFNADKTREEWEKTLDRMIGYGAKINEEEKQLIIDYLVSR